MWDIEVKKLETSRWGAQSVERTTLGFGSGRGVGVVRSSPTSLGGVCLRFSLSLHPFPLKSISQSKEKEKKRNLLW